MDIKLEFIETSMNSSITTYSIYQYSNNYYMNYDIKMAFNQINNSTIKITKEEYEVIINHIFKYYKLLDWNNYYDHSDYYPNETKQWHILVYKKDDKIKEITGYNTYPKQYQSFKKYFINKYNTIKNTR